MAPDPIHSRPFATAPTKSIPSLLALLAALPVCAQEAQRYWYFDVHRFTPDLTGHFQGVSNGSPIDVDFRDDLALKRDSSSIGASLEYQGPRFGLQLSTDAQTYAGLNTVNKAITIQGQTYQANTLVSSRVKATNTNFDWTIRCLAWPQFWLGVDLGARFTVLKLDASGGNAFSGVNGSASYKATLPIPQLGPSLGFTAFDDRLVGRGMLHMLAFKGATYTHLGADLRYTNQPATNPAEFFRVKKLPPPGYADGYRGIWFTLGQFSEYGDKYSGGLGTYTADHIPIAIYSAAVNKTFFVYGGTIKDQKHLLIMASYYDHATGQVPRPTLVLDKGGVNDPHDNAALVLDAQGYLWVFVSGRATARPGWKFRSKRPYSVEDFEFIRQDEMTYPQPRFIPGFGFFNLFTKYTNGRELYWETSTNGINWSAHQKLAGIGGHYQVSNVRSDGLVASFFNRHPGGDVDKRTDLYYLQTTNYGATWTTASGLPVTVPLTTTTDT